MAATTLPRTARIAIASLGAATAALWVFLGLRVGHDPAEDFELTGWAAITCTLALVATVIGVVLRDSVRAALVAAIMASQPGDGPAPLHLVKADRDAG